MGNPDIAAELTEMNTDRDIEDEVCVLRDTLARDNALSRCSAVRALERMGSRTPATAAALINMLHDDDPDVRADVASALGKLRIMDAVSPLLDTLEQDPDGDTRIEAAKSLVKIGTTEAVERLIACVNADGYPALDGPSDEMEYSACWEVQAQCLEALGEIGDARAVDLVVRLLGESELEDLHAAGFRILAKLNSNASEQFLLVSIRDGDRTRRRRAILAIAAADSLSSSPDADRLVDALCLALKDQDAAIRLNAVRALSCVGDGNTIAQIASLLADDDREIQKEVATALYTRHGQTIVRTLHIMLRDPNPVLRSHLVELLGEIGNPESVPLLQDLLKEGDARVLFSLLGALIKLGATGSIAAITPFLMNLRNDVTLRARAAEALGVLISQNPKVVAVSEGDESNPLREILRAKRLVPEDCLVQAMLTDEVQVQNAALNALLLIFNEDVVPILIACLTEFEGDEPTQFEDNTSENQSNERDPAKSTIAAMIDDANSSTFADAQAAEAAARQRLRILAARLLPRFATQDQPAAIAALISSAAVGDPRLHREVVLALGQIADPTAITTVLQAFQSEHADVRLAAIDAMSKFESHPDIDAILNGLIADADATVRARAVLAVGRGGISRAKDILPRALMDKSVDVCRAALTAVTQETLTGQFVDRSMDLMFRFPTELRHEAATTLRRLGDRRISEPLIKILKDPDQEDFHWICIDSLGDIHASAPALEA